jgi:hypothetical protein
MLFLDGRPFSRRYQIDNVLKAADSLHQKWRILECICPEDLSRRRLEDHSVPHAARNRNFQLYLDVKSRFEAITLPKTVIDTSQILETSINVALAALR